MPSWESFTGRSRKSLTIRIDADVLAWVKRQGKGYQTRINSYLRRAMESAHKKT
jgi:uncharacterized protein (DUF4415 family)